MSIMYLGMAVCFFAIMANRLNWLEGSVYYMESQHQVTQNYTTLIGTDYHGMQGTPGTPHNKHGGCRQLPVQAN